MRLPDFIYSAADWLRHDLPRKRPSMPALGGLDTRWVLGGLGAAAVLVLAWALLDGPLAGDDDPEVRPQLLPVAIETGDAGGEPVGALGFPVVATRNTTRVSGPDPVADAAAVALATHPTGPGADPVEAAILVADGDPYAGIAASVFAGPPLRAPILIGGSDDVPEETADALAKLDPRGGSGPGDAAVLRIGDAAAPDGYRAEHLGAGAPAEVANRIDQLRGELLGAEAEHIVVASGEDPAYAMPAAAWAARSGDPVLFSERDSVPEATLEALNRHRGTPVYVLGPESVVSEKALRELERVSPGVQRVGEEGPAANSIAFARYFDESFGWNITDPGHGLVVANSTRPLDAAAAASLSASGKWGPLLVVESQGTLPVELRNFLLDIQPGYQVDPTRAVYNHVWLIGDSSAIGATVQAEIDELAELTEVTAGGGIGEASPGGEGAPGVGAPPGDEDEPAPGSGDGGGAGSGKKGRP